MPWLKPAPAAFTHLGSERGSAAETGGRADCAAPVLSQYEAPGEDLAAMQAAVAAAAGQMGGLDILVPNVG